MRRRGKKDEDGLICMGNGMEERERERREEIGERGRERERERERREERGERGREREGKRKEKGEERERSRENRFGTHLIETRMYSTKSSANDA